MLDEDALWAEDECIENDVSLNKSNIFDLVDISSRSFASPENTLDGYFVLFESTSNLKFPTVENLACSIYQKLFR
jgi:hypothetical protein